MSDAKKIIDEFINDACQSCMMKNRYRCSEDKCSKAKYINIMKKVWRLLE